MKTTTQDTLLASSLTPTNYTGAGGNVCAHTTEQRVQNIYIVTLRTQQDQVHLAKT